MGWQDHRHTNFACNSIGPNFNKRRKRCNSNDANSMFEQAAGELHAKLLCRQARPRGRQAAAGPGRASRRDTETTATQISHAIRLVQISTNAENAAIPTMQIQCLNKLLGNCMRNCCADRPGRGAARRRRGLAGLRDATPRPPHTHFAHNFPRSLLVIAQKRCNSNDMNSIFEALAGELRAELLSGRAWPGFETTHAPISTPRATGVEGAGGSGGHGRASRRGAERSEALASRAGRPRGGRKSGG